MLRARRSATLRSMPPWRTYVVEPQRIFVPFLVDALTDSGLEVTQVSARFDPAVVASDPPPIVFLDIDVDTAFPEEVIRLARSTSPRSVLVVYAAGDPGPYRRAGADEVVSKTLDVPQFQEAMRDLARRRAR
jgi:DNA-binding response OmpR family regulator